MKKKDDIIGAYDGGLYKDKRKNMKALSLPDAEKA